MLDIGKKLIWLVSIFPGFLTITIVSAIVDLGDVGEFGLTFYSLGLTFIDVMLAFILCSIIVGLLSLFWLVPSLVAKYVIFATATLVVSIVVGIFLGIALERGSFFE